MAFGEVVVMLLDSAGAEGEDAAAAAWEGQFKVMGSYWMLTSAAGEVGFSEAIRVYRSSSSFQTVSFVLS